MQRLGTALHFWVGYCIGIPIHILCGRSRIQTHDGGVLLEDLYGVTVEVINDDVALGLEMGELDAGEYVE